MSETVFFDTNVLLYMYDGRSANKRERAIELFRNCLEAGSLVISSQVIQEFYVTITRKLSVAPATARALVADLCDLPVISVETAHILRAIDLEARYQFHFWDALILSTAEAAEATVLYSEDFQDSQICGSIRLVNPFLSPPN